MLISVSCRSVAFNNLTGSEADSWSFCQELLHLWVSCCETQFHFPDRWLWHDRNDSLDSLSFTSFLNCKAEVIWSFNKQQHWTLAITSNLKYCFCRNLSHNALPSLKTSGFNTLQKLRSLNLAYNSISQLEDRAFDGLGQLRTLWVVLRHYAVFSTIVLW